MLLRFYRQRNCLITALILPGLLFPVPAHAQIETKPTPEYTSTMAGSVVAPLILPTATPIPSPKPHRILTKPAQISTIEPQVGKDAPKEQTPVLGQINASLADSKTELLKAAEIPESDWQHVDFLVTNESGWNPCAYNPGKSDCNAHPKTACGLVQQNPCHKIPGDWRDPVLALKWQKEYVKKFGGYAGAVAYWKVNKAY